MQRLITDNDREFILNALAGASDEVLVRAYQDWDAQRTAALQVRASVGSKISSPQTNTEPQTSSEDVAPAPRPNVSPGASSISKIGGATKDELFGMLARGTQPPAKYSEHLKLLWSRGEVNFDGKDWYV